MSPERTVSAYEAVLARPRRPWRRHRRRLAIVSPFPPISSGIANYSFRLVEELAAITDREITCSRRRPRSFSRGAGGPQTVSRSTTPAPSGPSEGARAGFDEVVYVLGNGEFHTAALESLRRRRRNRARPRGPPERPLPLRRRLEGGRAGRSRGIDPEDLRAAFARRLG